MRVVPLRVNYQGTVGYFAFWAGNLRSVYAMTYEDRSNDTYETHTDTKGVWIYHPMDRNEYIIKVCRRPFLEEPRSSTLLVCRPAPHFFLHRGKKPE